MPPRRLGAPLRRPLDIRRLAAQTLLNDLEDAAPAPAADADLVTLTRWSVSGMGGVAHLMGLDDWGHVVAVHILAIASDGTWAQRVDGSYVRLADPWPLPLARTPGDAQ
ncbi:hypothetical protein [Aureimonas sp. SK2]|uniref:hypothetical protein n=1 Tax=Aureimonas sp. SK2 TaxID=3015992 RepID=UPI002443B4E0|nr:hypothetical protein [Aureimonas sp. SK2]